MAPRPSRRDARRALLSTTVQNQMIKDKQYIEPGKVVDFKDETRFDQTSDGWKGQDGKIY